jgi:hypothetical protein
LLTNPEPEPSPCTPQACDAATEIQAPNGYDCEAKPVNPSPTAAINCTDPSCDPCGSNTTDPSIAQNADESPSFGGMPTGSDNGGVDGTDNSNSGDNGYSPSLKDNNMRVTSEAEGMSGYEPIDVIEKNNGFIIGAKPDKIPYGITDFIREIIIGEIGYNYVDWGAAKVPKPGGVGGGGKSGKWTSEASKYLRNTNWGKNRLPIRMLGTKSVGGLLGRIVPYLGWGLLGYDVYDFSVNFPWNDALKMAENKQNKLDGIFGNRRYTVIQPCKY